MVESLCNFSEPKPYSESNQVSIKKEINKSEMSTVSLLSNKSR